MQQIKTIHRIAPDLGADLTEHRDNLIAYAHTEGKHNAQLNEPTTLAGFTARIFNQIETVTQGKIYNNMEKFLSISGMAVATNTRSEADLKCKEHINCANDYEHDLKAAEKLRKQYAPDPIQRKKRMLSYIVVILTAIAEGYLILEALRRSGFPPIPALFTALGMAAGIAGVTHAAAQFIAWAQTRRQMFRRACLVLLPMLIFFMYIGRLRADAYNSAAQLQQQISGTIEVPPGTRSGLTLAIVSFILYAIGLGIAIYYAKSKEEKEREKAYNKASAEVQVLQAHIDAHTKAIETIQKEAKEQIATALATYEYALARERALENIAKEALVQYAVTNLRHRTDGHTPTFLCSLPTFKFTTFFTNKKTE